MAIFDFLSDLFGGGGQSPQAPSSGGGSYSWIGPLISAVGNVAGRARWTPRADATASDIREANRNNMIAQLLGAGAQAYQGYQEQQAYGSLADLIKQGSMTTTMPQSPLSSQIFGWGQANPQFAKTATALGLDQLQNEQKFQSELNQARIKANQPPSFTEMAAANSYFKDLIPDPTERQAAIEEGFRQRGKSLSPSSSANNFDALRQTGETYQQTGKFPEVTLPPGTDMGAAVDALKGAAGVDEITQPDYGAPGTQTFESKYPKSAEIRRLEKEDKESERERLKQKGKLEKATATEQIFQSQGRVFNDLFESAVQSGKVEKDVNKLLAQKTRFATAQALTILKKVLDNSVLQSGEYKTAESQLQTWRDRIKQGLFSIKGEQLDFSEEARQSIRDVARTLGRGNLDSAAVMEGIVNEAVDARMNNKKFNRWEELGKMEDRFQKGVPIEGLGSELDRITQSIEGLSPTEQPTPSGSPQPTPQMGSYQGRNYIVGRRR
jgi:hypothetical protein